MFYVNSAGIYYTFICSSVAAENEIKYQQSTPAVKMARTFGCRSYCFQDTMGMNVYNYFVDLYDYKVISLDR